MVGMDDYIPQRCSIDEIRENTAKTHQFTPVSHRKTHTAAFEHANYAFISATFSPPYVPVEGFYFLRRDGEFVIVKSVFAKIHNSVAVAQKDVFT
jgi:hypothetical protein